MSEETSVTISKNVRAKVCFDYHPPEAMVIYPAESAYPGCAAEAEILSVEIEGVDILCYLNTDAVEQLEKKALASFDITGE